MAVRTAAAIMRDVTMRDGRNTSFIGELLMRHPGNRATWPGENLLTEATAAVLRRAPPVAAAVAAAMLESVLAGADPPPSVEIATQHHVPGVGTPDLVLTGGVEHLVWVEAKDWAPESGDQLLRYWHALETEPAKYKALIYLTRTGADPPSVRDASSFRWSDVAKVVADSLEEHAAVLDAAQQWILTDYLGYLKERGLAMTEPLQPTFPLVLREFQSVLERLRALRGMVNDLVCDARWVHVSEGFGKNADDWHDWWAAYEPQPGDAYRGSAFDWGMLNLSEAEDPIFIAGLWLGESWDHLERRSWIEHVIGLPPVEGGAPFEDPVGHGGERLCRSVRLVDLPGGQLTDQARAMAKFALETFEVLRAHPPERL
jgi:hypothetical protein